MSRVLNFIYTLIAAAQAFAWLFILPELLKPHWEQIWSHFSPFAAQLLLNQLNIVYFTLYSLVMLPIYYGNFPFFEQYKISDKPWAWRSEKQEVRDEFWKLSWRSVKLIAFNAGLLIPLMTSIKYFILGDNMSFSTSDWPSYQTMFLQNVLLCLIHEFGFYWSHRIAHYPSIYRFHKVHHEYKQNTVLASQHEHPVDYIVTIASPALLSISIVQPHSIVLVQFLTWAVITNLDDHVGYEFPWSPVRWFWFSARTDQHEFHHSKNMGCFASKLNIYDKIFDSEKPYLLWRSKRDKKTE
jgi:sterol desaturase/sphingolipid hydroxylase (fatty acid hydroxylase superfamily)